MIQTPLYCVQVYETVENMLLNPDEVLKTMKTREMETNSEQLFWILSLIFGGGQISKAQPWQICQTEAAHKQEIRDCLVA